MPRFKETDRDQGVMIPISYKEQILSGTFEHAIDYIVDNRINTEALEARYRNDETGASAYSPKALLKIVLFAYSRGIISSRKIEQACYENVIFMALTGGQAPDFTTIAKFVRSLKDQIKNIFRDVLLICSELDLLGGTEFALDGCKMSSNASKEWSGTFAELKKKKEKFESTVKFLLEKHSDTDNKDSGKGNTEDERRKKQIEKIEKKAKKIEKFLNENKPKPKSRGGERKSNITDNESAKMKTSHGMIQGYNGMAISDSKNQVIIEAEAFGSGQEQSLLKPIIEGAKDNADAIGLGEEYLEGKTVIADTGSFSEDNIEYLSEEEIDAYIPDQQFRNRDPRFPEGNSHREKKGLFKQDQFSYDENKNYYICPAGKILRFDGRKNSRGYIGRYYRAKKEDCQYCYMKSECLKKNAGSRSLFIIDIRKPKTHSEMMMAKIDTPEGRDIYSRRMGIIEPVFGNIKNAKGLDRFTLRTKEKVNIQWVLYCMVHNIEKIIKYGNYEMLAVI